MNAPTGRARAIRGLGGIAVAAMVVAGCGPQTAATPAVAPMAKPVASKSVTFAQSTSVEDARRLLRKKPTARTALKAAERFRAAGNREAVFLLVKYAAFRGSRQAAYEMGRRYDPATHVKDGIVLKPQVARAAEWYTRAAEKDHLASMVRLGEMYRDGLLEGTADMNATELSFFWFDRAEEDARKDPMKTAAAWLAIALATFTLEVCAQSQKPLLIPGKTTLYERVVDASGRDADGKPRDGRASDSASHVLGPLRVPAARDSGRFDAARRRAGCPRHDLGLRRQIADGSLAPCSGARVHPPARVASRCSSSGIGRISRVGCNAPI